MEFPAPVDGPETILLGGGRPGARTILSKSREARDNFNVEVSEKAGKGWAISISFGPDRSTLGNLPESPDRFPVSTRIKRLLENGLQRLFLDSARMRQPSPPTRQREVFAPNGSNLPRVIRRLREEDENVFEDWLAHVRAALPEIDDIRVIVLAADKHIAASLEVLIGQRRADLDIRPISFDVRRHPESDPGCRTKAVEFLRPLINQYRWALVVFDHQGCGSKAPRKTHPGNLPAEHGLRKAPRSRDAASSPTGSSG